MLTHQIHLELERLCDLIINSTQTLDTGFDSLASLLECVFFIIVKRTSELGGMTITHDPQFRACVGDEKLVVTYDN